MQRVIGATPSMSPKPRPTPWYRLQGDVSSLLVPLCDPVRKDLERYAALNPASKIVALWQVALCQGDDPDGFGYEPFPQDDEALAEVYHRPDGEPLEGWPWDEPGGRFRRPTNWDQLFECWYYTQHHFGMRELVTAFGDAMEALTGLPLGSFAPFLALWSATRDGGGDGSPSKPASASKTTPTEPRSGPRSSTSKRKAPTGKTGNGGSPTSDGPGSTDGSSPSPELTGPSPL